MAYVLMGVDLNHGMFAFLGLSPDLQSMEQIRRIMRPTDVPDQGEFVITTLAFCHRLPPQGYCVTCSGLTQTRRQWDGVRMIVEFHSHLGQR